MIMGGIAAERERAKVSQLLGTPFYAFYVLLRLLCHAFLCYAFYLSSGKKRKRKRAIYLALSMILLVSERLCFTGRMGAQKYYDRMYTIICPVMTETCLI